MDLRDYIRDIPDFPKPGIIFKDITPLLADAAAMKHCITQIEQLVAGKKIDKIAGIEARGFIIAVPLAIQMGVGFIPIRKAGKLPSATVKMEYALEYGKAQIEIHEDACQPGENVLIADDLLATGGTMAAAARLVEQIGGKVVGCAFLIELAFLGGRNMLPDRDLHSLIVVD